MVETIFIDKTIPLIQRVKGKVTKAGIVVNKNTKMELEKFTLAFQELIEEN